MIDNKFDSMCVLFRIAFVLVNREDARTNNVSTNASIQQALRKNTYVWLVDLWYDIIKPCLPLGLLVVHVHACEIRLYVEPLDIVVV